MIRVFWQSSGNSGGAGVTITSYRVRWTPPTPIGGNFTDTITVTPSRQGLEFFERTITGLTNGDTYQVRVEVISSAIDPATGNPLSNTTLVYGAVPRANAPAGGWQPYQLPEEETASLNERTRRGEPLRVCTSAPDFVATINSAVNAWNDALNPTGSNFQDVFTFSNTVSHPTACGEQVHPQRRQRDAPGIIPNANFDIIISDYRCTPPTPPATGTCAAPAVQQGCLPRAGRPASTQLCSSRRCTDLTANTDYCAGTSTFCPGVALGCVWPRISNHTGDDPSLVEGSAIQIVAYNGGSNVALFAHELGHLLGLDDYGFQCAWKTSTSTYDPTYSTSRKQPSLFSYSDGPRSWRAVIANPSLYTATADYFDCRSSDITTRDEEDFRAIYRPKRFTRNRFIEETDNGTNVWRLEFGNPPTDVNPTATGGRSKVYNAYQWLILHRAPNPGRQPNADCTYSGPYATLTADTREDTTSGTSNNRLLAFTLEQLTDTGEMDNLGSLQNNHFRLNTNFNTTALREHQFIIVGITRGDPLADDTLPLGTEKSVVNLDLNGDGVVEEWTLGEPSIPFRTRPCNSTSTPISSPSTTTPAPAP